MKRGVRWQPTHAVFNHENYWKLLKSLTADFPLVPLLRQITQQPLHLLSERPSITPDGRWER